MSKKIQKMRQVIVIFISLSLFSFFFVNIFYLQGQQAQ